MDAAAAGAWMGRHWPKVLVAVAVVLVGSSVLLSGPRVDRGKEPSNATVPALPDRTGRVSPVVVAVGDLACAPGSDEARTRRDDHGDACRDADTAALVDALDPVAILALGDLQYEAGTAEQFRSGYATTWGRFKDRTRPVPGNHEYDSGGSGYFEYFGTAAGDPTEGWYSFDLGPWHLVALNSNCGAVGGCAEGSAQLRWLRADLAAHTAARCTLAYMHHPRLSSGENGHAKAIDPLWETLVAGGVDVLLVGHDHDYERFAPADAAGARDDARGVREFVVGSGGRNHYDLPAEAPLREASNTTDFGVLSLTLALDSYDWEFVPAGGRPSPDSGRGSCH